MVVVRKRRGLPGRPRKRTSLATSNAVFVVLLAVVLKPKRGQKVMKNLC